MRVFVTSASGYTGSAVVQELMSAGHQVTGLARSDASAESLITAGAEGHRGVINDFESLKAAAAKADGVIHFAYNHDYVNFAQAAETGRLAIETIGNELVDSGKLFVVTFVKMMLKHGVVGTEKSMPDLEYPMTSIRGKNESIALDLASCGVRVVVVRLPPINLIVSMTYFINEGRPRVPRSFIFPFRNANFGTDCPW